MKTKNKRNYLKEKGITLIALVVTIVVLLILAGVSISVLFGDNGIIKRAQESRSTVDKSQDRDEISITLTDWEIEKETKGTSFEEYMKKKYGEDKVTAVDENEVIVTTEKGNRYRVKTDGTITSTVKVKEPVNVSKGAFVEYNVAYKDAYKGYDYTATNGWRLLDYTKNADGTYSNVKLISTGVPARLYYYSDDTTNSSWYVTDSAKLTNFKNVLGSDYQFYTGSSTYYGLQASAGMYYNFGDIKFAYGTSSRGNSLGYFTEITSNGTTYNSTNTTETTGSNLFIPTGVNAKVRLLTLPEMNKMLGRTDIDSTTTMTDPTGADGLFVLQNIKNITGMSSNTYNTGVYWLASPYPNASNYDYVCSVDCSGGVCFLNYSRGVVRPVVSLESNIQLTDDGNGVLKID